MRKNKSRHKVQHIKIRESARKAIDYLHEIEKFNVTNFINRLIIQIALELGWRQDEILDAISSASSLKKSKDDEELIGTSIRLTDESQEALEFLRERPEDFNLSRYAAESIIRIAMQKGWKGP